MTDKNNNPPNSDDYSEQQAPLFNWNNEKDQNEQQGSDQSIPEEEDRNEQKDSGDQSTPDEENGKIQNESGNSEDSRQPAESGSADHSAEENNTSEAESEKDDETEEVTARIQSDGIEGSLGQSMMEARAECNLSVAQVAQQTKISAQFINFLENDDFDQLPPAVYSKSYIRQLCREYGVDPESFIEEYKKQTGERQSDHPNTSNFIIKDSGDDDATVSYHPAPMEEKKGTNILDKVSRTVVIGGIVTLLLIVLAAFLIQQYRNWQMHQAESSLKQEVPVFTEENPVNPEEFIMPQQLPLKELSIPGSEESESN